MDVIYAIQEPNIIIIMLRVKGFLEKKLVERLRMMSLRVIANTIH